MTTHTVQGPGGTQHVENLQVGIGATTLEDIISVNKIVAPHDGNEHYVLDETGGTDGGTDGGDGTTETRKKKAARKK
jgi:hypothetical protein